MYITPRIEEVKALEDNRIYIKFKDGKIKVFDMSNLIQNNKYYEKLKDKEYFNKVCARGVTVEWPNGEDVCPENLYNDSIEYEIYLRENI